MQHVLLDERDRPERLALQATDTYGPRQVPIAFAEAARLLDYWLEVRDAAGVQGDYVFPSKVSGTQWSEESLLKKTRAVMTRAGLAYLSTKIRARRREDLGLSTDRETIAKQCQSHPNELPCHAWIELTSQSPRF